MKLVTVSSLEEQVFLPEVRGKRTWVKLTFSNGRTYTSNVVDVFTDATLLAFADWGAEQGLITEGENYHDYYKRLIAGAVEIPDKLFN